MKELFCITAAILLFGVVVNLCTTCSSSKSVTYKINKVI